MGNYEYILPLQAEGGGRVTRFERAIQSPMEMSLTIAFCIAGYLEQSEVQFFTDEALKQWMLATGNDIEKWLNEEVEG